MPRLKFKHPCNDCPFRRAAARGWLGNETNPQVFVNAATADHVAPDFELPCHLTIDYSDPRWRDTQYPDAALCAGAVIFCRNWEKMPRDPARAANVRAVERDTTTVFATPEEFIEHHVDRTGRKYRSRKGKVWVVTGGTRFGWRLYPDWPDACVGIGGGTRALLRSSTELDERWTRVS